MYKIPWGWLASMTSPLWSCPLPNWSIWYRTVLCMAPKWTGMWGALDTSPPSGPNKAQEKSNLSLMLVEIAVLWSMRPICSEIQYIHINAQLFTRKIHTSESRYCYAKKIDLLSKEPYTIHYIGQCFLIKAW